MISRQAQQLAIVTLLLFCSTQRFAVDSVKTHEEDFYTVPKSTRPYISSRITGKPFYATPYYVPTGVKAFHDMGVKGRGIKLGIIDSGTTHNIAAFKRKHGYRRNIVPFDYSQVEHSFECNNRGINLAGIAIANSTYFTGVAPEATLGSYRVFGCKGPTSTSLVLQAIIAAINDEMKIIVLPEIAVVDEDSIKLRQAIENAVKQGVIMIVAATANNFANQQYFSYQGLSVLSVGGARQDYRLSHWFEEKTTGRRIEFMSSCSDMEYDFKKEMNIIPNYLIGSLNEHLNGFKRDGIVLVWYDKTKIEQVLKHAKAVKMTAIIIVNGPPKLRMKCDIPLFNISEENALFIVEGYKHRRGYKYVFEEKYGYIKNGDVTIDTVGRKNGPFIPPFYPDILAPSHKIFTTTIRKTMSNPYFSDISAAVAYVAGAAALIVQISEKERIDTEYIKTILQNSAAPVKESNLDYYASVIHQGAGMINLNKLIDVANILVAPSSINMGDTYANIVNVPIKISPLSSTLLSYNLSHIPIAAVPKVSYFIDMSLRPPVIADVSFQNQLIYFQIK
ncbi:peptidase S8/S53 domain-containing protein [Syncephalis fuscata]|nr:peptidase S8/S53 domain-containing protein [Syncephalis fuscata]